MQQDPKKNAAMFNMFGDSAPKKEPEIVRPQQPPQPPAKETNINALFGTGPIQKDSQNIRSPVQPKKEMNFNFEDAWKAE